MKKGKIKILFLVLCACALVISGTGLLAADLWSSAPAGEDGVTAAAAQQDPVRITTAVQLSNIGNTSYNAAYTRTAYYVIDNNITIGSATGFPGTAADGSDSYLPYSNTMAKAFTGVLDGQGYTVTFANDQRPAASNYGVIGVVGDDVTPGVEIRNVNIAMGTRRIRGNAASGNTADLSYIGALAGRVTGGVTVSNCSVTGSGAAGAENINGNTYTGALIGRVYNFSYSTGPLNMNITISNCYASASVSGSDSHIGGLIGQASNSNSPTGTHNRNITVSNCYASGDVSGNINTGGLIGYAQNYNYSNGTLSGSITVSNCFASGSVKGNGNDIGGLIGYAYNRNYSTGTLNGSITVSNSYASGNVTGGNGYTGGLIGQASNDNTTTGLHNGSITLTNCYASGNVTSNSSNIGGLIGQMVNASSGGANKKITVESCVVMSASVTGSSNVGRIVGKVTNTSGTVEFVNRVYYNSAMAGPSTNISSTTGTAVTGTNLIASATAVDLRSAAIYNGTGAYASTSLGWTNSGDDMTVNAGTGRWMFPSVGSSYPVLRTNPPAGTASPGVKDANGNYTPIRITTAAQLASIGKASATGTDTAGNTGVRFLPMARYVIANNITIGAATGFSGTASNGSDSYQPYCNTEAKAFTGVLDGQGYIITFANDQYPAANYYGIIGFAGDYATPGVEIRNVNIAMGASRIRGNLGSGSMGNWTNVGALAGMITGGVTVSNCCVTGSGAAGAENINGGAYTGGLIGNAYNYNNTAATRTAGITVSNCYASASVRGNSSHIGGLIGRANNHNASTGTLKGNITVLNCYASGSVSSTSDYTGGLIGHAHNSNSSTGTHNGNITVSNCYATGAVNNFTNGQNGLGGLIGQAYNYNSSTGTHNGSITVSNCYASGVANASGTDSWHVGGLIGSMQNSSGTGNRKITIESCAVMGAQVTGGETMGRIVGTVANTAGTIEFVNRVYYNSSMTGPSNNIGSTSGTVTGTDLIVSVTLSSLRSQTTYTGMGWDFGTAWAIDSSVNNGFPYLRKTPPEMYTLLANVNNASMGSVSSAGGEYMAGESITFTATANTGYRFVNWSANGVTLANPASASITFTMPANAVTLTAIFEAIPYTVSVTNTGGYGTVTGGGTYNFNNQVTVTVSNIQAGWAFDKWTSSDITIPAAQQSNTSFTFEMPAKNVTVTATYKRLQYQLTTGVNDGLMGSVNLSSGLKDFESAISITATANTGYRFVNWTIDGISGLDASNPSLTFNMPASNVTLTANFAAIPYTVNIVNTGGYGTVAGGGEYTFGGNVSITATANTGYRFVDWTIDGIAGLDASNPSLTFNMPASNVTLTANFAAIPYTVNIVNTGGYGTVAGGGTYYFTNQVTVTVSDIQAGWAFDKWTSSDITIPAAQQSNTSFTFEMPAGDVSITAVYINDQCLLTTGVNNAAWGSVNVESGLYTVGESISITATANTNYRFVEWTIEGISGLNRFNPALGFTMPANAVTLTAVFEAVPYTVSIINTSGNGTVAGGGQYAAGNSVSITATANTGYRFKYWEITGISGLDVSNPSLAFNMPANDVTLTAYFEPVPYTVSITNTGGYGTVAVSGGNTHNYRDQVTVSVSNIQAGWLFDKWTSSDITIPAGQESNQNFTFEMPAGGVTITATYKRQEYLLSADVDNAAWGRVSTAGGQYGFGESVSITATAEAGYRFAYWTIVGISGLNPLSPTLEFTMPASDAMLRAVFEPDMRTVTVVSEFGTVTGSGLKQAGVLVTLSISGIETGRQFAGWSYSGIAPTTENAATLRFIMPAGDVTVTVLYAQTEYDLNVLVNNPLMGSTSINGVTVSGGYIYYYNDSIQIRAVPLAGYRFAGWTVTGITADDPTNPQLAFSMPARTVTVQAVFESALAGLTVTKNPGDYAAVSGMGDKAPGSVVTLTVLDITPGWEWLSWDVPGTVTDIRVNNATTLQFVMPAVSVAVTLNLQRMLYELTVTVNDPAMGSVTATELVYEAGDFILIRATAEPGFAFKKWLVTGAAGNNSNNATLTFYMPANAVTVEAVFEPKGLNVNVISEYGTVTGFGNAYFNSEVVLTIESMLAGWELDHWQYSGISPTHETSTTLAFVMPDADVTVTAVYRKIVYTFTANVNNNAMGEIIDIAFEVITGGSYTAGEQVTISARAKPGFEFLGWQGIGSLPGITQNGTQIKFLMPTRDVTVVAVFGEKELRVTVTSPEGSISGNSGTYFAGGTVTITANPNSGYRFLGWASDDITITGDITNLTLTFTMPGHDVLIIASYIGVSYTLAADSNPTEGGLIDGNAGIYRTGDVVSLTAQPAEGYKFSHWESQDIVILNPINAAVSFVMPAKNCEVVAVFEKEMFTVTVVSQRGTVSGNAGGYYYGAQVTLTAIAQSGYLVVGWNCDDVDLSEFTGDSAAFEMPAKNIMVIVVYEGFPYTITVVTENGSVTGAWGTFAAGELVTLSAIAETGYAFGNWSCPDISIAADTNETITFMMPAQNIVITALFILEDYSVTVIAPYGFVTGNERTFNYGDTVTITLTLKDGYTFAGWSSEDLLSVNGMTVLEITFQMPAQNVTLTAEFDVVLYDLTVVSDHGDVTGVRQYAAGEEVILTADAYEGYEFERWESADIAIANPTSAVLSFPMPGAGATVTAVYRLKDYTLTVDAGAGSVEGNKGGYKGGESVTLAAIEFTGVKFERWQSDVIVISPEDALDPVLTFTMPNADVKISAVYSLEGFTVTVVSNHGTVTFDRQSGVTENEYIAVYEGGETVNLMIEALPGYRFVRVLSSEVAFQSSAGGVLTFTMPYKHVYITVVYVEFIEVKVVEIDTDNCDIQGEGEYNTGDYVEITVTPKPGYRLAAWESDDIQLGPIVANPTLVAASASGMPSYTIHFIMPSYSISIRLSFEEIEIEGIAFENDSGTAFVGDSIQLNLIVTPTGALAQGVLWTSSDESIAAVDQNGLVKILGKGTVTITATCGEFTAEYTITAEEPESLLWLWISLGIAGTLVLFVLIVFFARSARKRNRKNKTAD